MSSTLERPLFFETLFKENLPTELKKITEKVLEGKRLNKEEGLYLLESEEHESFTCQLADWVRQKKVGDAVYFASTFYIHPTNLCEYSCPMCSYYAKPGWKSAWFLSPEEVENKIKEALKKQNLTEIHVVGGLWRDCDLNYYQDIFTRIKKLDPNLHIKALTPVEYDFLANLHNISVEEVFLRMMEWGLGSLPGGGAEILVEKIRKQVAPQKISSDEYLNIHKIAHRLGLNTNITMLFGHVEDPIHIIEHLDKVRLLQDETGGFKQFVPLKYHVENNALGKRKRRLKLKPLKRVYAVSRLMLDNLLNLKVLWNYLGINEALELLSCGGNDLSSTNLEERIIIMAGGVGEKIQMNEEKMEELILSIGRTPKKIHSGYNYSEHI